jgi:hypothetical protein
LGGERRGTRAPRAVRVHSAGRARIRSKAPLASGS